MIAFIDLQTNEGASEDWPHRRKVSIVISDREPESCRLLGNLEHQTEFRRDELVAFARQVLEELSQGGR